MNNLDDQNEVHLLRRDLELIRERYLRLADLHGKLQTQNSFLEERVLDLIESSTKDKEKLEQSLSDAQQQIDYLQETVQQLQIDKQKYKADCNLAVHLLHRYPDDFLVTHSDQLDERLKTSPTVSQRPMVMSTFPPTCVAPPSLFVSNSSLSPNDQLRSAAENLFKSAGIDRSLSTSFICAQCNRTVRRSDVMIQTDLNNAELLKSRVRLFSNDSTDDPTTWLPLGNRRQTIEISPFVSNLHQV